MSEEKKIEIEEIGPSVRAKLIEVGDRYDVDVISKKETSILEGTKEGLVAISDALKGQSTFLELASEKIEDKLDEVA